MNIAEPALERMAEIISRSADSRLQQLDRFYAVLGRKGTVAPPADLFRDRRNTPRFGDAFGFTDIVPLISQNLC